MENFLDWTLEQIEDLILRVYNGVVTKDNLPPDLYNAIVEKMVDALDEGFGNIDPSLRSSFEDNIKSFSFAKTFQQINDMQNFLLSDNGNIRPFSQFKKEVLEIFEIYNNNWLETEYKTAISLGQSAAQWVEILEQSDALPLLQYQTVGDERVRQSHRELDNIIKPVNDPFWEEYFPPNDWNCRCIVIRLEEGEATNTEGKKFESVPDIFRQNPAKDGFFFSEEKHPYFKGLGGRKNGMEL